MKVDYIISDDDVAQSLWILTI